MLKTKTILRDYNINCISCLKANLQINALDELKKTINIIPVSLSFFDMNLNLKKTYTIKEAKKIY